MQKRKPLNQNVNIDIRGDQSRKLKYQKALTSLKDFKQLNLNIEDLDEEETVNLSEDVKNSLMNQIKEQSNN